MKPNPFASLNHFTRPCAMRATSLRGLLPLVLLPPPWRGCPPMLEDKQKRHATGSSRGVYLGDCVCTPSKRIRSEPERRKLYTKPRGRSTNYWGAEAAPAREIRAAVGGAMGARYSR